MPRLPFRFRSSKSKTTHQSRRTWPKLRRSKGAVAPKDPDNKASTAQDEELHQLVADGETGVASSCEEEATPDNDETRPAPATSSQHEQQFSCESETGRKSNDSSEISRSQHGSKRLKKFVARFHGSKSHGGDFLVSLSEALQTGPEESKTVSSQVNTEPAKNDQPESGDDARNAESKESPVKDGDETVPSAGPSVVTQESKEQSRNVSAQTMCSQESKVTGKTVSRHPSQRLPMPIQDPREDVYFQGLLNYCVEATHQPELSDPFSDGKNVETSSMTRPKSKGSDQSTLTQIKVSGSTAESSNAAASRSDSSKTATSSEKTSTDRVSSGASRASRASRSSILSRIDPTKAAAAFNRLAKERGVQLSIPDIDVAPLDVKQDPTGNSTPRPRHRLLHRVRPTQSSMNLEVDSQPSAPKLRRTKTFANFSRRPRPMTSLRGKSLETLARLGGHSFLVMPVDLAPAPLQLPACIVATVMYLRKRGASVSELFEEPGDIKAATTLYDHFASQVLSTEKEESKIALTMRVIAMPHWETDTEPGTVLSVGWVFKALLEGLPGGILGSVRLWETLRAIYTTEIAADDRVRFIALAMIALVSEIQCALICGVFGFFSGLLQQGSALSGNTLRPVASPAHSDRISRIFGPLLIDRPTDGESAEEIQVEQEIAEQRVAGMFLEHWRSVSRQLREWSFAAIRD